MAGKRPKRKPFVVTPIKMGLPHDLNYNHIEDIEKLEGGPKESLAEFLNALASPGLRI